MVRSTVKALRLQEYLYRKVCRCFVLKGVEAGEAERESP